MSKRTNLTLLLVLLTTAFAPSQARTTPTPQAFQYTFVTWLAAVSDREQDGLVGPVRRVKTETSKITIKGGRPVEGPRAVLETTTYDQKGTRVDNAYFLATGGALTGKEVYKYDERGNIVEMTLHNADGTLLSKETYAYEFDAVGNWVKMTTSVAVIEGGKVSFEPSEVTYRIISYYLDETMVAKMSQPAAAQPVASPVSVPPAASNQQTTAAAKSSEKTAAPASQNASAQKGATAPVIIASLDRSVAANPSLLAAATSAGSGPSVKADGEAPAAKPVMRGPLKPISGGILNGKALNLPPPAYPEIARRTRVTGTVEVEVLIDVTGKVMSAKSIKGPTLLQTAAEAAARLAKFTPTLLSGQPVRVSGVITYNFTLQR